MSNTIDRYIIVRTPRPPKGGRGPWEIKKEDGSMVQGQVFLKGGELALLLFNFFKVYHFYIWKLFYPLQNCVMHSEKKKISATIILWKTVIRSCLKMNLKITFSIVNNPYPLHTYMHITETCSLKFTIISFWGPALKSTAENGIPKKPLDTSLLKIFFNL